MQAESYTESFQRNFPHYVEMIHQMKATNLVTGEQGERFMIYMYNTGSDDSGTDTAKEGGSHNTTSKSETFH